jgi:hypothetical protein
VIYLRCVFKPKGKGGIIFEDGNVIRIKGETPQFYVDWFNLWIDINGAEGGLRGAAL